jgi:hypothetical protein
MPLSSRRRIRGLILLAALVINVYAQRLRERTVD